MSTKGVLLPSAPAAVGDLIESFLGDEEKNDKEAAETASAAPNGEEQQEKEEAQPNNRIVSDDQPSLLLPNMIIRSWTPSTSHLLLSQRPSSSSPAFDILDHALGRNLPVQILREVNSLRDEGLIDDLKPARTAMEVKSDQLIDTLLGNFAAVMADGGGTEEAKKDDVRVRGDKSAFIPRSLHRPPSSSSSSHTSNGSKYDVFCRRCPGLCRLISSVEQTAIKKLGSMIRIDTSLTSVQCATYPGDGISCYPRHCDRGDRCASEPTLTIPAATASDSGNARPASKRIVTAVYYLTPEDWDADMDGGALRVYPPGPPPDGADDDNTRNCEGYHDAIPYSDRMVIFRSDMVEHEVLPSLRRERTAITVWLYGNIISGSDDEQKKCSTSTKEVAIKETTTSRPSSRNPPPPLPLGSSANGNAEPRIFVSIPSYRDPETRNTISSLFATAKKADRVFVGVVWQIDTSAANADAACIVPELPNPWSTTHVRELTLDYRHATGPCLARALAQTLLRDEEYILQIDSHMRFRDNWDVYLLNQLNKCPEKSVLTAYPPAYVLDSNGEAECVNNETRGTILVPWKFSEGMLRQKGRLLRGKSEVPVGTSATTEGGANSDNDNVPCPLYAAGFNFSSSSVIKDCPYDASLHHLFFGEEMSMAVRLFTHGYDFYAPAESVCYHKWTRDHRPTIQGDNNSKEMEMASKDGDGKSLVQKHRKRSLEVVMNQLRGDNTNLGSIRTASEFASRVGVNFEAETILEGAENGGLPPDAFAPTLLLDEEGDVKPTNAAGTTNGDILALVSSFLQAEGNG